MSGSITASVRRASLMAVALAAVGCGGDPPAAGASASPSLPACMVERSRLVLGDGTEVYVEYQDVIQVGDDLLLAGSPSYHWKPAPGRSADLLSSDEIVAAYFGRGARTVPKPVPGRLGSVRAAALDDRSWGAVMLEVDPDSLPGQELFTGLWYGEYDGARWSRVEAMPPLRGEIMSRVSSALVRAGDRMAWAAWESPPGEHARVRIYERSGGAWVDYAVPELDRVELVELAYSEGSGLWMLISGYDAGLPGFQKSLRLYRERSPTSAIADRWEFVSRVTIAEQGVNLAFASFLLQPGGAAVSWAELSRFGTRVRTRVGIGLESPGTVYTLADDSDNVRLAAMPDGSPAWVVAVGGAEPGVFDLQLLRLEGGTVKVVASFPSPFPMYFTVRAVDPHEIVVVGPELGSDSIGVPFRSLLLRLSTSC
ncbi:MAG: hypothetical protein ABL963_02295 [Longimicrobiales bacterium]